MRLIFDKEIEFLKKELNIYIPSQSAWMDRMNVKIIDSNNKWHIIYKIKAEDMKLKLIKNNCSILNNINIKKWYDLIDNSLIELEEKTKQIIKNYIEKYDKHTIVVPVSGGKDSAIVYNLVEKVFKENNIKRDKITLFSNTTNENHITYKYIKTNYPEAIILSPKKGFYQLIKEYGIIPSRFNRYCCSLLKEHVTIEQLGDKDNLLFIMGMRAEESQKRSHYDYEWRNIRWTNETWNGILPLLKWTEIDVWLYMLKYNIPINDNYIGVSRVGCMYCPYRSSYELIIAKEFFPKYHERWENVLKEDFINHGKATVLNCSLQEYINGAWKAGLVRDEPTEEIIQEFAEYKGLDINIARKYFNKTCSCCGSKLKKDEIALSMKYFGRQIEKMFCFKCLGKNLNMTKDELKEKIKEFKEQGCSLF